MKAGDKVAVKWDDGSKSDGVTLVDHTDDFKNATIRTKHGGLMNGMVRSIVGSIDDLRETMKGQQ